MCHSPVIPSTDGTTPASNNCSIQSSLSVNHKHCFLFHFLTFLMCAFFSEFDTVNTFSYVESCTVDGFVRDVRF